MIVPPHTDKDDRHKHTYAVVGELVMLSNAIDHQLNQVLMSVLNIAGPLMVEPVVATIDTRLKIEILKERAKHIADKAWKNGVVKYCAKVENVFKYRNIACHTPAVLDGETWTFKPVAAAKILKKIDIPNKTIAKVAVSDFETAIKTSETALGDGINLIENFQRLNAEFKKRAETKTRS
jgi:hypothetical protein